jgi:hypothetical protein
MINSISYIDNPVGTELDMEQPAYETEADRMSVLDSLQFNCEDIY